MQITTENKDKYKNITEVSFMIFRTGSVLIVGMCDENVLQDIYTFLKALLKAEFKYICQKIINDDNFNVKDKKKKLRKKTISIVTGLSEEKIDETMSEDDNEVETVQEIVEEIIVNPIKKTKKERKTKAKLDIIDDNIEIIEEA
jgi:hypothetical protein